MRILVAVPDTEVQRSIAGSLRDAFTEATIEPAGWTSGSLEWGWSEPFDAAICRADDSGQLECVAQLREKQRDLPVLLVSLNESSQFRRQALSAGIDSLIPLSSGTEALARNLRLILDMREAQKHLKEQMDRSGTLKSDLNSLVQRAQTLRTLSSGLIRRPPQARFLPLIVEADMEQAYLMVRSLAHADIYAPLPMMRHPHEARAYLSGSPPYTERERFPLPTVLLVGWKGGDDDTLDLVRWIRASKSLLHLPVLVLTEPGNAEDVRTSFGALINSCLIRGHDPEGFALTLRAIDQYWSKFNLMPELS